MNHKLAIAGLILGVVGFIVLGIFTNMWAALGVFLMITGNNFERSARK